MKKNQKKGSIDAKAKTYTFFNLKFFVLILALICSKTNFAQWTSGTLNTAIQTTGGNVGIGISAPSQKLHIEEGNILVRQGGTNPSATLNGSVYLGGVTHQGQVGLRLTSYNQGSSSIMGMFGNSLIDVKTSESKKGLIFRVDSINGFTERMIISANGNVGIGTSSPRSKLEIQGNAGNGSVNFQGGVPLLRITSNSTNYPEPAIAFQDGTTNLIPFAQISAKTMYGGGGLIFQTRIYNGQTLTEKMRILDNGNVGIGTSNPTQKIHVFGGDMIIDEQNPSQVSGYSGNLFFGGLTHTGQNGLRFSSVYGTASGLPLWFIH